jgi:hypothetical protein
LTATLIAKKKMTMPPAFFYHPLAQNSDSKTSILWVHLYFDLVEKTI